MKKLKLNLDDIKVESFETIQSASGKGTVMGNGITVITEQLNCYPETANPNCSDVFCTEGGVCPTGYGDYTYCGGCISDYPQVCASDYVSICGTDYCDGCRIS